jgi:hypothetical protein
VTKKKVNVNAMMTDRKTRILVEGGMVVTGNVLMDPETGEYAFVDQGRVQWMGQSLAQTLLGHRPPETLDEPEPTTFRQRVIADLLRHNVIVDEPNEKDD